PGADAAVMRVVAQIGDDRGKPRQSPASEGPPELAERDDPLPADAAQPCVVKRRIVLLRIARGRARRARPGRALDVLAPAPCLLEDAPCGDRVGRRAAVVA